MAARRPEAAAPANELQACIWGTLFCSSSWELRYQSTSEYQSPAKVIPLSHKVDVGLGELIKKGRTKRRACPMADTNNGKMHGNQSRASELHQSIFSDDRSKPPTSRCSCVDFATKYNVHCGKPPAGHLLGALRLERCTAAIIFPHNKMAQKINE